MMRVFIITDNLMKGGKERRLIELLRYFDRLDYVKTRLVILRQKIDYLEVYDLKNTEFVVLKRKIRKDPFVFFQLWNLVKEFNPGVIHSWGSMPSVYMFMVAYLNGIPFLNAMITNAKCKKYSSEWLRTKITFPFSTVILSNSYAGLKAYHAPQKRSRVIYNGFNIDRINHLEEVDEVRNRYAIKTPYVIGMVAAFHARKDYETFLEVANRITYENKEITFIAIGDGEQLSYYKQKYNNKRIIFTGNLNRVESLINIFTIGVLLTNSNNHLEGISNSLIEYMALGIPVIATRGGGTDELVHHNKNGLLIDNSSQEQLHSAINVLLGSVNLREQLVKNGRKTIQDQFSIESMADNTLKLYKEVSSSN